MPRRPRKPKTFYDVTHLTGKEYYQLEDGVTFRLEDTAVDKMIYMGDLLGKFYRINKEQNPLVFHLIDEPSQLIRGEKIYQVIMRGNFYMVVEKGHELGGPHRCCLWFQAFSTKQNYWIASLQIMAFFFNADEVKTYICNAVNQQEFFMLPENRDKPIVL
jgi:hypothetical protein